MADGDREALDALMQRHAGWLVLRLAQRCDDAGLVDEVVQDTFVRVWRKADTFRGTGDVGAWIWGIAIRRLLDHFRKRRPVVLDIDDRRAETVQSAEDAVLVGIEHGELGPAVNRLSPELRQVLRATVLDGLTTREAAELLGIPQGTVKTRLMRARRQLREDLT